MGRKVLEASYTMPRTTVVKSRKDRVSSPPFILERRAVGTSHKLPSEQKVPLLF